MMQGTSSTPRCLIVEDEVLVGMDVEEALRGAGFDVRWVASAQSASSVLATTRPDVVVLDVVLREMHCARLAQELKGRRIPFVVHSGYSHREASGHLKDVPWVEKPAEMSSLLTAVNAAMSAHG